MSGYLNFKRTGISEVDALMAALERAGGLFHHTSQWTDGYPNDSDPSPHDAIQDAFDAITTALAAHHCPSCDGHSCEDKP